MPYVRIWVHLVWSTKHRERIILTAFRQKFFAHIRENAKAKRIFLDCLNGTDDHVHAVISLASDQTIAKVVQLLKGESSNCWLRGKFEWQDDYFAVSVSESGMNALRRYVRDQEAHHRKKSFAEEYQEFIDKYGFDIVRKDSLG